MPFKRKTRNGYLQVADYGHGGVVSEHRLIAELALGRPLDPKSEYVHHIDGNKENNDPGNLEIVTPLEHLLITRPSRFVSAEGRKRQQEGLARYRREYGHPMCGKSHTEEARAKIGKALKEQWARGERDIRKSLATRRRRHGY